jgi:uncharacterized protein (TIGR03083 family)
MTDEAAAPDYSQPPRTKAELMERIRHEWTRLERALQGLSEAQMSVPDSGGWSIKDNLAHLAEWHRFLRLYHLRNQPPHEVMGVEAGSFETLGENGLNDVLFRRNKDRAAVEIAAELRSSYEQVLADLEGMTFEDLMQPHYADDPEKRPLIGWVIGNTYEHYLDHGGAIAQLARQAKT